MRALGRRRDSGMRVKAESRATWERHYTRPPARDGGGAATRLRRALGLAFTLISLLVLPLSNAAAQAPVRPAIQVTTTADAPDSSAGDGMCRTAGNQCSLTGGDPGVQRADRPRRHRDSRRHVRDRDPGGQRGLPVDGRPRHRRLGDDQGRRARARRSSTAASRSPGQPVEARGIDRIFEIHPSAGNVTIERLTLQRGLHGGRRRGDPELVSRPAADRPRPPAGQPVGQGRRRDQQRRPVRVPVGDRLAADRGRSRADASRSPTPSWRATPPAAAAPRSTTSARAPSRSSAARSSTTRA